MARSGNELDFFLCGLRSRLTFYGTIDEHSGLLEKRPLGAPEALTTPEEAGSKSSSSEPFETATISGEKRKRKEEQKAPNKAKRRSVGTAASSTAASNRPVRNRKPPNRFGYSPPI